MQVVAVASQKGGVGKTTVTANLSVALAQHGIRVLAMDLDYQAALTAMFGPVAAVAQAGVERALLRNRDSLSLPEITYRLGSASANGRGTFPSGGELGVVPASGRLAGGLEDVAPRLVRQKGWQDRLRILLDEVATEYDIVVMDCPPRAADLSVCTRTAADHVIIPLRPSVDDALGAVREWDFCQLMRRTANARLRVLGALLVAVDEREREPQQIARTVLEQRPDLTELPVEIPARASARVALSADVGGKRVRLPTTMAPGPGGRDSLVADRYRSLASHLIVHVSMRA
jgi:chromosome partitioning protein